MTGKVADEDEEAVVEVEVVARREMKMDGLEKFC